MSCIWWEEPGQPKIRNFWGEILIKKDIACLYISVDYRRADFIMEISKVTSNTNNDFDASSPIESDVATARSCKTTLVCKWHSY
jgi:hypothetical protein